MAAIRAFAILFVAASAFAEPYTFEPPAPTTATSVLLRVDSSWRDSCLPRNPLVTRNGNTIDVLWELCGTGYLPATWPWQTEVPLGMFEPGTYNVVLRAPAWDGVQTFATKKLVVAEYAPLLRMVPAFASTRGGSEVTFTFAFCQVPPEAAIEIDGAAVPIRRDGCLLIGTLPPHAAGPVDVTIRSGGSTTVVRSALRYVDPAAAPDPALFERILIPVLVNGPGAFGSQWVTEGSLHNVSAESLDWLPDVARPASCGSSCFVPTRASIPLSSFGDHANGRILFVPRAIADRVQLTGIVRDVSRAEGYWGSELPFAREKDFRTDDIILPNVPVDARYRVQLRLYGIDGASQVRGVAIWRNGSMRKSNVIDMPGPCSGSPCNSFAPSYASVDINAFVPNGIPGPVDVIIYRASPNPAPTWALVSITNNTTQHVTTIRPQ